MNPKRVLIIASHRPGRAPNQRFRIEQFIPYLEQNGFYCELSWFISEADDKVLYTRGNYFNKFLIHRNSVAKRKRDALNADDYDIIFIVREALLTGSVKFEKLFARSKAKVIYDFDDAIWHLDVSDANKLIGWLKKPSKTSEIIGISDLVFAGNNYLAEYALKFNKNVKVIPSTVNTAEYTRIPFSKNHDRFVIGWSGSITTIKHFEFAVPFLKKLKQKYGDRIEIRVVGDGSYVNHELGIKGIAWSREEELRQLSQFDAGLMPLPDDEWTKGKCGLKGLLYMSMEIPALMSPVGVNNEIITHGVNGFLPRNEEEWISGIELLIADPELARKMGIQARKTVLERYSTDAWKDVYLEQFRMLTS